MQQEQHLVAVDTCSQQRQRITCTAHPPKPMDTLLLDVTTTNQVPLVLGIIIFLITVTSILKAWAKR
jgi:hypothetical protein